MFIYNSMNLIVYVFILILFLKHLHRFSLVNLLTLFYELFGYRIIGRSFVVIHFSDWIFVFLFLDDIEVEFLDLSFVVDLKVVLQI